MGEANGLGCALREWQGKRLEALANAEFPPSRYDGRVTVIAYTFPSKDSEVEMFRQLECSILHTWSVIGKLKTVIVADRPFDAVVEFSKAHDEVELQIASNIIPGNIKTMSLDCIKFLYSRFSTPYCLIIQDDGFPLRDSLGKFLELRYDFIGAPIISDGWKRHLAYSMHIGSFNGGFSLRSHSLCEYASRMWFSFFSKFMSEDNRHLGEDFYYTTLLKFIPATWLKFRFPSESDAFRFAVDSLGGFVKVPDDIVPLGFHGRHTADLLFGKGVFSCP